MTIHTDLQLVAVCTPFSRANVDNTWTTFTGLRITSSLPPVSEVLSHILCFTLIEEILFYYGHAAFHIPYFYQRIHKQHHEFKAPFALAAAYAHPIEGYVGM